MKKVRLVIIILALGLFCLPPGALGDWSAVKRLTWTSGHSGFPAIAADSENTIHVVWHCDAPGNQEIYYRRSSDGGTTWNAIKRLTWTSGRSGEPAITIDSGNTIHVVWHDDAYVGYEIYYKKGT